MIERMRIKKYQQPKVEEWSKVLELPENTFVEEAINFYVRYLEDKLKPEIASDPLPEPLSPKKDTVQSNEEDEGGLDDFTGTLEL